MRSVYSTLTASRQLCDSLDLCLGMPTYIGPSKQAGGLLNKQGAVRTASDVAPCYRRVTAVLPPCYARDVPAGQPLGGF